MSLLIIFLTFVLVMNCLFLMLLILIQLPKKEAGAGIAFGGGATDALFGAGSGNALTRLTKYAAGTFVALSVLLSVLNMNAARDPSRRIERELARQASTTAAVPPTAGGSTALQSGAPSTTTNTMLQNAPTAATNLISGSIPATSEGAKAPPVNAEAPAAAPKP